MRTTRVLALDPWSILCRPRWLHINLLPGFTCQSDQACKGELRHIWNHAMWRCQSSNIEYNFTGFQLARPAGIFETNIECSKKKESHVNEISVQCDMMHTNVT